MSDIAIIGYGYWGKIIESKLKSLNKTVKVVTKDEYKEFLDGKNEIYEHIIISTPSHTHVDIVSDLTNNLSLSDTLVFCEKPFTKNIGLFSLLNDTKVYISDVFLHNNKYLKIKSFCRNKEIKGISIETYNGSVSQKDSIIYDLMYHDLYMLMNLVESFSIRNISIHYYDDSELKLSFVMNDINVSLYYSRKSTFKTKDVEILTETGAYNSDLNYDGNDKDAIENMFTHIFEKEYNLEYNNILAKECVKHINEVKDRLNNTISIIGAGVYGCLIGIELSNRYNIVINEKNNDILQETTKYSLWRIHRGYHYPRCNVTAQLCKNSYNLFLEKYPGCLVKHKHIYCIAKCNSKTTSDEYISFMETNGLPYREIDRLDCLHENPISSIFEVDERLYDVSELKKLVYEKISGSKNLHLNLNTHVGNVNSTYCRTLLTSYWNNNNIVDNGNIYEYQICEVVMIKLPGTCKNLSITIMDGPFLSLNPLGDVFGLYDVENTIIHRESTCCFEIPDLYKSVVNRGIIKGFEFSKHKLTLEKFECFFKVEYEYLGSQYSVRVLNRNDNDSRFCEINRLSNNVYSILSSKVDLSLLLAGELANEFETNEQMGS